MKEYRIRSALRGHIVKKVTCLYLTFFLFSFTCPAFATESVLSSPCFLNGEALYLETGCAGLASIAADAAHDAAEVDIAILGASSFGSSIPAGEISDEMLSSAIPAGQQLVTTSCSVPELVNILNESMIFGSQSFPHLSGISVVAYRVLNDDGNYKGVVGSITQGDTVLCEGTFSEDGEEVAYTYADAELTLVTTKTFYDNLDWLPTSSVPLNVSLQDAFCEYMERTADEAIRYFANRRRLIIIADTIDADLAAAELMDPVPTDVQVDLRQPVIASDTIFYALSGQDRSFVAHIWDAEIPYALSISGLTVSAPVNVDTTANVTQTLPNSRKTANTFDDNTIFVDLRYNPTIPDGTLAIIDVSNIYPSETVLHVYYYDQNGDIVPQAPSVLVDADGFVTFRVRPSTTYVLNAQQLDHSTLFGAPTTSRPFIPGIAVILSVFTLWVVFFLIRKRRERKHRNKTQNPV